MKADLSRSTFSPTKHYRDVRWQMGRVPIDADLNELVDIVAHRVETETIDVVGRCGGPIHDAAFQLATAVNQLPAAQQGAATALGALTAGDFFISAGRYYVQGILVENDAPLKYSGQAAGDLPDVAPLDAAGLYLAYVHVWPRHLTHIDDPSIREIALGGPDTATRNKNVWQLRLVRVANAGTAADCAGNFPAYDAEIAPGTGQLAAEVDPDLTSKKPCVLPPGGGYRRLENQLYRVEIHDRGAAGGAATFKWSRDNGAIVSGWEATGAADTIRLRHPPRDAVLGFAIGQWVELTDDRTELLGVPGTLVQVTQVDGDLLTLSAAPAAGQFTRNPKVRRWDGAGAATFTANAWIALEDGVRVRFSAGDYRTGDYWMIPARTATADVEWPRANNAAVFLAPHGVRRAYCRIGFIDFDGTTIKVQDCRPLFPPLTEIDSGGDLKLHNKHLHGKGVVCGLQVNCAGGNRADVVIRPGHAIDCEGTDILLREQRTFPAVERATALNLLDPQGNGEALLTLVADTEARPVFDLRAAPPEPKGTSAILRHILQGTIWIDFYEDCLQPLVKFLQAQLIDKDPASTALVSPQEKRVLTVANLIAHRASSPQNWRLWLSKEQHALLENLYLELQKIAGSSKTFCGIADQFPAFPAYPFDQHNITTIFAARRLLGVRALPDGASAVAWSETDAGVLHLFDLAKGELVANVTLPGLVLPVQDAVVAQFGGKPALVVACASASQTALHVLEPTELKPLTAAIVLTGGALTRLETHTRTPSVVLAVQKGAGVHFIDVNQTSSGALKPPRWAFNATGHLAVAADRVCATATASAAGGPPPPVGGAYTALRFGNLGRSGDDTLEPQDLLLSKLDPSLASGEDGIVFALTQQGLMLHVVVNPPSGRATKGVAVVEGFKKALVALLDLPAADGESTTGAVRLGAIAEDGRVIYALGKRNQLLWTPSNATKLSPSATLPAQAEPLAIAGSAKQGFVLAANRESMTLTRLPIAQLAAPAITDAAIDAYRDAILAAYASLVTVILQGLKDCLCEHLLVDCPECGPDDFLPLAKIEIRGRQVYHICNFERLEVLTFPKVKYWLSAVPVIPLVSFLVERFCCHVFEQPRAGAAPNKTALSPIAANVLLGASQRLKGDALASAFSENFQRAGALTSHLVQGAGRRAFAPAAPAAEKSTRLSEVLGADAAAATNKLNERGVVVDRVASYDEALGRSGALLEAGDLPSVLKAGEKVELFTRGDKVVFFRRVGEATKTTEATAPGSTAPSTGATTQPDRGSAELSAGLNDLRAQLEALKHAQAAELAARDARVAELGLAGAKLAQDLAARDVQLAELKSANAKLEQDVQRIAATATTPPGGGAASPEVTRLIDSVRAEVSSLKETQSAELTSRDRQLAELKAANEKLAAELAATTRKLQADLNSLRRRPSG